MNILQITPSYKPAYGYGGTITSVGLLCEMLAAKGGCKVTVATTTANGKTELPEHSHQPKTIEGVQVFYFPRWTGDHSHLSPALLWWVWRNIKRFDAVHIHSWWNLVVLLSTGVCILRGVRPVLSPRGMLSPFTLNGKIKPLFHKFLGKKLLGRTVLHATSEQECVENLALIPNWKHAVLPNFLDIPTGQNTKKKTYSLSFRLLFLSRIHEKKGLEILFEALSKTPFDWSLTIAGDGDENYVEQLKKLSEKLRISLKINWLGWVNAEKRLAVLQEADLLILPSHNENFANVVIESLAVGTPVLVSKHVGLSEYVAEKNVGWICDTTVESVQEKITEAYAQTGHRQHINATSGEVIQKDFDPSVLVGRYIEVYQKV